MITTTIQLTCHEHLVGQEIFRRGTHVVLLFMYEIICCSYFTVNVLTDWTMKNEKYPAGHAVG